MASVEDDRTAGAQGSAPRPSGWTLWRRSPTATTMPITAMAATPTSSTRRPAASGARRIATANADRRDERDQAEPAWVVGRSRRRPPASRSPRRPASSTIWRDVVTRQLADPDDHQDDRHAAVQGEPDLVGGRVVHGGSCGRRPASHDDVPRAPGPRRSPRPRSRTRSWSNQMSRRRRRIWTWIEQAVARAGPPVLAEEPGQQEHPGGREAPAEGSRTGPDPGESWPPGNPTADRRHHAIPPQADEATATSTPPGAAAASRPASPAGRHDRSRRRRSTTTTTSRWLATSAGPGGHPGRRPRRAGRRRSR